MTIYFSDFLLSWLVAAGQLTETDYAWHVSCSSGPSKHLISLSFNSDRYVKIGWHRFECLQSIFTTLERCDVVIYVTHDVTHVIYVTRHTRHNSSNVIANNQVRLERWSLALPPKQHVFMTSRNVRNIYNTIQYNTIQYNTIQYNTIQYNTIQYNTIQYNTIQYNTIQYNTIQYIQYNNTNTTIVDCADNDIEVNWSLSTLDIPRLWILLHRQMVEQWKFRYACLLGFWLFL